MTFFTPDLIADVIIQVTFIATFIGIFFFTYASKVEQEVVQNQMDFIVQDFTSDIVALTPPADLKTLQPALNALQPPDLSAQDQDIANSNSALLKKAIMILGIVLLVGTFTVYKISENYNLNFKEIVKTGLIVVAFVALTEFSFLTFVAKNYRSADPNVVKLALINSLQQYIKS